MELVVYVKIQYLIVSTVTNVKTAHRLLIVRYTAQGAHKVTMHQRQLVSPVQTTAFNALVMEIVQLVLSNTG